MIDIKRVKRVLEEGLRSNYENFASIPEDVRKEFLTLKASAFEKSKQLPVLRDIESLKVERDNYKEAADKLLEVVRHQAEDVNFRNAFWDGSIDEIKRMLTHDSGGALISRASIDQYVGPPFGFIGLDQWEDYDGNRLDIMDNWDPWTTSYKIVSHRSDDEWGGRIYEPVEVKTREKPDWAYDTYGPQLVQEINKAASEGTNYSEQRQKESTHEKGWMIDSDRDKGDLLDHVEESKKALKAYYSPVVPTGLNYENEEDEPNIPDSTWQKIKKLFGRN